MSQKVALVTGSSRGLGYGVAHALGKAGAKVVLNYLNDRESAEKALAGLKSDGIHAMLVRADVSNPEQISSLVEAVEEKFGSLDILVPNATPEQPQKPIEEYDADFYRQMYDFFVMSPFHLTRAVLPGMKKRGHGRIINITSEVFHCSVPEFSAYVAAKGGQIGWSRSSANELAPHGITVNTVAPGLIDTPIYGDGDNSEAFKANLQKGVLFPQRLGGPEELASMVIECITNSYMNAESIRVDGGIRMPPK